MASRGISVIDESSVMAAMASKMAAAAWRQHGGGGKQLRSRTQHHIAVVNISGMARRKLASMPGGESVASTPHQWRKAVMASWRQWRGALAAGHNGVISVASAAAWRRRTQLAASA
jgi:hypothetical protein